MSIQHNGNTIVGTFSSWQIEPWERPVQRNMIFGRDGATQISGGRHMRLIRIPGWIHGDYENDTDLQSALDDMSETIGDVGTLSSSGTVTRSEPDCDFTAVEILEAPIPSSEIGWFADVVLVFTQLKPG